MELQQISDALSNLTLQQSVELTKMLEDRWGVKAMSAAAPAPAAVAETPKVVEQTEFDVILTGVKEAGQRTKVIQEVKKITNLSLLDSKTFVDAVPKAVKEGLSKAEADALKTQLEAVGALIEIK